MNALPAVAALFRPDRLVLALACLLCGCSGPFFPAEEDESRRFAPERHADYYSNEATPYFGQPIYPLFAGSSWYYGRPDYSFRHPYARPDVFDRRGGPPGRPAGPKSSELHRPGYFNGQKEAHGPRENLAPPPRGKAEFQGAGRPDSRPRHPGPHRRFSPDESQRRAPAAKNPPPAPERRFRPENGPGRRIAPQASPPSRV
ncbi:MAG: hypothetical protein LBJ82_03680, partial [Deltaproteobacteria bacterium]|nr:hypothetical protein [Deltaproteobacteria bacterium]